MATQEQRIFQDHRYDESLSFKSNIISDTESNSDPGSCSPSDSDEYDPEWVDEVSCTGDLFYVGASLPVNEQSEKLDLSEDYHESLSGFTHQANNSQSSKSKHKGKLKNLIKRKKVVENGDLGPREVPGAEDSNIPHNLSTSFEDNLGEIFEITLDVDPKKHNYGRRATLCEALFGIIPGRFSSRNINLRNGLNGLTNGDSEDVRIMVQGLIPDGEAMNSEAIKIGDWLRSINGIEVTFLNINQLLNTIMSPTKVKLTVQRVAKKLCNNKINGHSVPHQTKLAKLVSRKTKGEKFEKEDMLMSLLNIPHIVLYLTSEGITEQSFGKKDILYQFPQVDNKLVQIRGMFITIGHILNDVTASQPLNSSLVVDDKLVHVGYSKDGNEILVIALPDESTSVAQLHQLMIDVVRLLKLQYHSLHKAFTDPNHKIALDHLFGIILQRHLISPDNGVTPLCRNNLCSFQDTVPYAHWLPLPSEIQIEINNVLSEFASGDFFDMSDDCYDSQRTYTILGSSYFYKGYLLVNHLPTDDLIDIHLYLRHYGLLTLTKVESISQVVIWKEVFPTRRNTNLPNPQAEMHEPLGRWFLLIIGMKHNLLVTLLEAGGCAVRAEGNPGPDPFFVDQARYTLIHLETIQVPSSCELWLNSCPKPALANVDWFIHPKKSGKEDGTVKARDPSPNTLLNIRRPQAEASSILKKKTNQRNDSKISPRPHPSVYNESATTSPSPHSSGTSSNSGDITPIMGRREPWSRRSGSDVESRASSDGALYRSGKKGRWLPGGSNLDLTNLKHELPDDDIATAKLTTGCENILFHYVSLESADGVIICPKDTSPDSMLSTEVLDNFQSTCLVIQQMFYKTKQYKELLKSKDMPKLGIDRSLSSVKEFGILFQCSLPPRPNQKKPSPTVTYWVVGRLFSTPAPKEIYVCFLDSAPQTSIELAFKLAFGLTL